MEQLCSERGMCNCREDGALNPTRDQTVEGERGGGRNGGGFWMDEREMSLKHLVETDIK